METSTVDIHPNVADLDRCKVTEMQALLHEEGTRLEAMEVIRALIDRIEVHAGGAARPA